MIRVPSILEHSGGLTRRHKVDLITRLAGYVEYIHITPTLYISLLCEKLCNITHGWLLVVNFLKYRCCRPTWYSKHINNYMKCYIILHSCVMIIRLTRLSQATHIAWGSAAVTDIFPQLPV